MDTAATSKHHNAATTLSDDGFEEIQELSTSADAISRSIETLQEDIDKVASRLQAALIHRRLQENISADSKKTYKKGLNYELVCVFANRLEI
jgi:hypothetical protein